MRDYKEQHPLVALAEDTKGLIGQSASYEVQLRTVEENLVTAQGLLDTLQSRNSNNNTGSLLLIQAVTLGDPKLVTHVEALLALGEKKLVVGANYSIPDPARREIEVKTRQAQGQLADYVSILLTTYKKQAAFLQQVLQDYEAKMQKLPELEQGLSRLTRSLKVYQDIYSYLIQRREETQIARAAEVGYTITVVDPSYVTAGPQPASKQYGILMGLVLGLVGGCALVVLRERHNPSLNSVGDVERSLELPVLGTIPEFLEEGGKVDVDSRLVVLHQPRASASVCSSTASMSHAATATDIPITTTIVITRATTARRPSGAGGGRNTDTGGGVGAAVPMPYKPYHRPASVAPVRTGCRPFLFTHPPAAWPRLLPLHAGVNAR